MKVYFVLVIGGTVEEKLQTCSKALLDIQNNLILLF